MTNIYKGALQSHRERLLDLATSAECRAAEAFGAIACSAMIWHGPGHQSRTRCQVTHPHEIHQAVYGSAEQTARWRGEKVFSGVFDEPPDFEEEVSRG